MNLWVIHSSQLSQLQSSQTAQNCKMTMFTNGEIMFQHCGRSWINNSNNKNVRTSKVILSMFLISFIKKIIKLVL